MTSQCSRLKWDQGLAVLTFSMWKDLSQGNWLSLFSFSSLSATHILDSQGVSHLKSQESSEQPSHITASALAQPSLVTTHFHPRSHPSGWLTSGFHTLKGHTCQGIQLPVLCGSELPDWRLWDALPAVASPAP